jgi:hypothetical protein
VRSFEKSLWTPPTLFRSLRFVQIGGVRGGKGAGFYRSTRLQSGAGHAYGKRAGRRPTDAPAPLPFCAGSPTRVEARRAKISSRSFAGTAIGPRCWPPYVSGRPMRVDGWNSMVGDFRAGIMSCAGKSQNFFRYFGSLPSRAPFFFSLATPPGQEINCLVRKLETPLSGIPRSPPTPPPRRHSQPP